MSSCNMLGRFLLVAGLVQSCSAASWAMEPEVNRGSAAEARAVLEKSIERLKKVSTVRYEAKVEYTGWLSSRPAVSGKVLLSGELSGFWPKLFVAEMTSKEPTGEELRVGVGCNEVECWQIDHADKKVYADMDPNVIGKNGARVQGILAAVFVAENPYEQELKAENISLAEEVVIEGESCLSVKVEGAGGRITIWHISKNDDLPRGLTRIIPPRGEGETAEIRTTMKNVEVNPKKATVDFILHVPEGYTRVDDFAPQ